MTIERRIRNKERCAYRGKKQRYSVWRAEHNQKWETLYEAMSCRICDDNDLVIEDEKSKEERNTWNHTYHDLREKGYNMIGMSIRNMMMKHDT
jgi:hypothetical protein